MNAPTLAPHAEAALLALREPGLVGAEARARIRTVAEQLPAACSRFFGFECNLGREEETADFLACIMGEEPYRTAWLTALSDAVSNGGLAGEGGAAAVWTRLARFVRRWADPGDPLHSRVRNMWVEFDLDRPPERPAVPSLFIGAERLGRGDAAPPEHAWLIGAVEDLTGLAMDDGRRAGLAACLEALPEGAELFQIGMMLSRPLPLLRLCATGLPAEAIPAYLDAAGWPGDRNRLRGLLDDLTPLAEHFAVDMDVSTGLHAKLGLECYLDAGPDLGVRMTALLDRLAADGLCVPAKRAALPAWYGLTHEKWRRDAWPADLKAAADRPGPGHSGGFLRTVNHIKIVLDPPAPLSAKAYLAARFCWIDDRALKRALSGATGP
ncbi:hypothetical protein AZL_a09760 (plasmid) [Azospirillum sp. B510]|uniref:hypothetical protein n=1 Tax=Azospirillum sp. (strain B510) TaxID=137722 RepID=UPI0001C4BC7B|nr:hypothetical protein [Azospirillum sp. B510]BAI74507.1 hypothetical protein AZL_a09760 [Azospirillum sp. B510]